MTRRRWSKSSADDEAGATERRDGPDADRDTERSHTGAAAREGGRTALMADQILTERAGSRLLAASWG